MCEHLSLLRFWLSIILFLDSSGCAYIGMKKVPARDWGLFTNEPIYVSTEGLVDLVPFTGSENVHQKIVFDATRIRTYIFLEDTLLVQYREFKASIPYQNVKHIKFHGILKSRFGPVSAENLKKHRSSTGFATTFWTLSGLAAATMIYDNRHEFSTMDATLLMATVAFAGGAIGQIVEVGRANKKAVDNIGIIREATRKQWYANYNDGLKGLRQGEWANALASFNQSLAWISVPLNNVRTPYGIIDYLPYLYRAVAKYHLGDYQKALLDLERAKHLRKVRNALRDRSARNSLDRYQELITKALAEVGPSAEPRDIEPTFPTGKFHALIIAVQEYDDEAIQDLLFPIRDAYALYDLLNKRYSFDSEDMALLINPTRGEILDALLKLRATLTDDDNLLIFFAGHGSRDESEKEGYWWPTNARMDSRTEWLWNDRILTNIKAMKARHTLLITDACFSGEIFRKLEPVRVDGVSENHYKTKYDNPSRWAMTSGADKAVPDESIFLRQLLMQLGNNKKKYLCGSDIFRDIEKAVIEQSGGNQRPLYRDLGFSGLQAGEFLFVLRDTEWTKK